jgi:crotonobetainyl-CoA:carnitine CoA-transferase CaiB-like acyl-CoA transferase
MLHRVTAPLETRRILDLTDDRGALCGRILADLGADVVRAEAVRDGDPAGTYRNANKRTLPPGALDAGLEDLLDRAEVLVENLDPLRRSALDLEPAAVRRRHPHLVHVVMADFGLDGPRAAWRLAPLVAQAAGGTLFASGFPELPPCSFPGYLGPDCASIYAAIGVVAALMEARRHGRGQTVEVSVQEAVLAGTVPWSVAIPDYLKINSFLPAEGRRNADGFYQVLPAADGWVRFVIGNEKQWDGAIALAGKPEVLTAAEWKDPFYRRMNADVARLVMAESLQDRTRAELFEEARQVGATLGVIHQPREYTTHPQALAREVFTAGAHPGLEGAPTVRPPLRFSATPGRPEAAPAEAAPAVPWPEREPAGAVSLEPGGLLLEGIKVVEFGMAAVGPEAALVLSELGADVVKVESSRHLDVLRQAGFGRVNCSFSFNTECRGRRSVTLNLDTEEGRRLALALCAEADVVVENFRGGVLDRAGLGYDSVKEANPAVVYASSQGYGRTGPLAEMPAYGPLNLGFAGLHLLWNHPDAPYPCGTSLNHPDHVAGRFLAVGILAALDHRERTGKGQRIDLAQTEFAAFLHGEHYVEGWRLGADPAPAGNDSRSACPHGVFPAAGDDRWIAVVAEDDGQWRSLEALAGWDPDPELGTLEGRLAHAPVIAERLAAWTGRHDAGALAAALQEHGVSACPVMGPLDLLADEHLAARRFFVELEHPEVGSERHEGNPLRLSATPQRTAASAPCLGAHTAEVLGEWLGVAGDEVERLAAAGVCG